MPWVRCRARGDSQSRFLPRRLEGRWQGPSGRPAASRAERSTGWRWGWGQDPLPTRLPSKAWGGRPSTHDHPHEDTREPPAPRASSCLVHGNPHSHAPSLPAPCSLPWSKPIIMVRVAAIISGVCLDNRYCAGRYLPALSDMSSQ